MIQNEQGSQRWKGLNSQIVYWAVAGAVWAVWPQAWLIWRWVLQNFGVLTARQAKKVVIRGYDFNLGARKLDIFQIPICNAWQSHDFFSFFLSFLSFFLGMRPLRYIAYTLIYFSYFNFQFRNCHFKKSQVSKIILLGFLSNTYLARPPGEGFVNFNFCYSTKM